MFRTVSSSVIRILKLYSEYQVHVVQVLLLLANKEHQIHYGMMLQVMF